MSSDKGLIRSNNRRGVRSSAQPAAPAGKRRACDRCGAIFERRRWRREGTPSVTALGQVAWVTCPACKDVASTRYTGRVVLSGAFVAAHEGDLRKRIDNVTERSTFTQPERRLVDLETHDGVMEVLTTSQQLAHRIVREITKAFKGRARYQWSDDGSLYATWARDEATESRAR